MSRMLRALCAISAPLLVTLVLFVAVLRSGTPVPLWRSERPVEVHEASRCTWACHNHGCDHRSRLPPILSTTLFDATVIALHTFGDALAPDAPFAGYRAANLLVFCILWPALTVALYVTALGQRRALRAKQGTS